MKRRESTKPGVLIKGVMSKLERSRRNHDFVLTDVQPQICVTAIAASAMGMGAVGVGLIGMAGNSDEEADWVEFELNGAHIKGWLWMMPMRNGDEVEVVGEHIGGSNYIAYAVKRNGDDLLAVYPHATAGRMAHYKRSIKTWFWFSMLSYSILPVFLVMQRGWRALLDADMQFGLLLGLASWAIVSAVLAFRASRKLMGFVRIAETIFKTFDWPDIERIDLRQTSKDHRRENRLPNFGNLYFRYK